MKRRHDVNAWVEDLNGEMKPEEVEAVLDRLALYTAPEPAVAQTEALLARLRPLMPGRAPAPSGATAAQPRFRSTGLAEPAFTFLYFLRPTLRLFRPVWWLASLAAVVLGLLLAPVLADVGIPLSACAPLLVVGAVAYGFRTLKGTALDLELTCAISPAQAVLARLLVITGYYLALGAAASLIAGVAGSGAAAIGVLPALLSWSASLLLFAGLMLLLTLLTGTVLAATLSLSFWGLHLALRLQPFSLFAPSAAPGWLPAQVTALLAGLLLIGFSLTRRVTGHLTGRRDG